MGHSIVITSKAIHMYSVEYPKVFIADRAGGGFAQLMAPDGSHVPREGLGESHEGWLARYEVDYLPDGTYTAISSADGMSNVKLKIVIKDGDVEGVTR